MSRKPRLELMSPNLDGSLAFVPGYDLLEKKRVSLSSHDLAGIALALWELSSSPDASSTLWKQSQFDSSFEGGPR